MSYESGLYAKALEEFGAPLELSRSGRWILRRPFPQTEYQDATGPIRFLLSGVVRVETRSARSWRDSSSRSSS